MGVGWGNYLAWKKGGHGELKTCFASLFTALLFGLEQQNVHDGVDVLDLEVHDGFGLVGEAAPEAAPNNTLLGFGFGGPEQVVNCFVREARRRSSRDVK